MWFWLWAKWCHKAFGYAICVSVYEILDIGYDQSGVVMCKMIVCYEIYD